jgi:hypothetical protein
MVEEPQLTVHRKKDQKGSNIFKKLIMWTLKKTCTHKIHHVGDINKFTIPVMAVMAVM